MTNNEFTMPELHELEGDKKLEFINDKKCSVTDFAIVTGVAYYIDEDLDKRYGEYYLKSIDYSPVANLYINRNGKVGYCIGCDNWIGIRPSLKFNDVSNNKTNPIDKNKIKYIKFGLYPQETVDENTEMKLNQAFNLKLLSNSLRKTGNTYTYKIDNNYLKTYEYLFENERYIRVKNNAYNVVLSNGKTYKKGEYVWLKVSPVYWLIDYDKNVIMSEKILIGGIKNKELWEDFTTTEFNLFLNNIFNKDVTQCEVFLFNQAKTTETEILIDGTSNFDEKLIKVLLKDIKNKLSLDNFKVGFITNRFYGYDNINNINDINNINIVNEKDSINNIPNIAINSFSKTAERKLVITNNPINALNTSDKSIMWIVVNNNKNYDRNYRNIIYLDDSYIKYLKENDFIDTSELYMERSLKK